MAEKVSGSVVPLRNARKFIIAVGTSRKSGVKNTALTWDEFSKRVADPVRTAETVAEYRNLPGEMKTELKDASPYIAGRCNNGRRNAENLVNRCMICLDMDHAPRDWVDGLRNSEVLKDKLWIAHTTRSHTEEKPRGRMIIPLSRDVSPETYPAVARAVAAQIDIEWFDPASFRATQVMYMPSVSCDDTDFLSVSGEGDLLDPEEALKEYYDDWRDVTSWPRTSQETSELKAPGARMEDPHKKDGLIGAFCRSYTIEEAIEQFIPDVYARGSARNRWTFLGSASKSFDGAVEYEGKFLHSYHETDPCGGRSVNAYDMVRLHRFKGMSDKSSMKEMHRLLQDDEKVQLELFNAQVGDFDVVASAGGGSGDSGKKNGGDRDWRTTLRRDPAGNIEPSLLNILTLLRNEPNLSGLARYNEMRETVVKVRKPVWEDSPVADPVNGVDWIDPDETAMREYLERVYRVEVSKSLLSDAVSLVAEENRYNPVVDYLNSLEWDGVKRIDTMLSDYLGVVDSPYSRAVSAKTLIGAVSRAFNPGCKFDFMLILEGDQGKGKSSFVRALAHNDEWFADSIESMAVKEAVESMSGSWIIEMAELHAVSKAQIEHTKNFLSRQSDRVRMAYERKARTFPRRCIFIGTTNDECYLTDDTGNRRYWPVRCHIDQIDHESVRAVSDQLWAEAVVRYRAGETAYLDEAERVMAVVEQKNRSTHNDGLSAAVMNWLDVPVPVNRYASDAERFSSSSELEIRTVVCAREVATDFLGVEEKDLDRFVKRINAAIRASGEWTSYRGSLGERYPSVRGWKRKRPVGDDGGF